jgi:hypothetical protein
MGKDTFDCARREIVPQESGHVASLWRTYSIDPQESYESPCDYTEPIRRTPRDRRRSGFRPAAFRALDGLP